jgi:lipid-A-disaccharide synthase
MIVVYRAAWPTYWVGRMVIRVKWLGMVNLIADRTLCPEFIQRDAKPAAMADALESLLDDGPERTAQLDGLRAVAASLEGDPELGPGEVVAAELARRAESCGA